jgi:hypothetical protein
MPVQLPLVLLLGFLEASSTPATCRRNQHSRIGKNSTTGYPLPPDWSLYLRYGAFTLAVRSAPQQANSSESARLRRPSPPLRWGDRALRPLGTTSSATALELGRPRSPRRPLVSLPIIQLPTVVHWIQEDSQLVDLAFSAPAIDDRVTIAGPATTPPMRRLLADCSVRPCRFARKYALVSPGLVPIGPTVD